jgi:UDP-2,4-diacetamido-2,4,6-trideoxy-beta-L-altropyranose hydrolase
MASTLFIRADASAAMGTGHIMRMIALGQAWQGQGWIVRFLCAEITPSLANRLSSEGFYFSPIYAALGSKEDLERSLHLIAESNQADAQGTLVVLDGYHFDSDYQLGIKAAGFKLLIVDDYGHAEFYHADWVVNQNISACEGLYSRRSLGTRLFLGPKFALLRNEFLAYKDWQRKIAPLATKVLVTMGGSDPDNVTSKVIEALIGLHLQIKVVIGGSNPHLDRITEFIQIQSDSPTVIEVIPDASNMPELMAWADLAVAAAGSTCLELAFMRLPSLLFILAENQIRIALEMDRMGGAKCLGSAFAFDKWLFLQNMDSFCHDASSRMKASSAGSDLVDGDGRSRIFYESLYFNFLK